MREHADMEIARNGVMALAVLVGTAVASILAAADGGRHGAFADQPFYPSIWQGLYGGAHVGFGAADGVLGAGQVGYNWQSGRVGGFEPDFALSSSEEAVRACSPFACAHASASLDWMATVLIDPRLLAYASAGIGIVSWSAEAGISGCPGCGIKLDGTESDFVFGLGAEGKISETMFARLDFLTGDDLEPMVFGQA